MYRNNMGRGMSPRDRLDPRLLERIALRSEIPSDISEPCMCNRNGKNPGSGCCERATENVAGSNSCSCNRHTNDTPRGNTGCGYKNQISCRDESHNDCDAPCETYNAEFDYSLAMVYSPYQEFQNLYCEDDGFMTGTIFRELDKHFYGPRCHGGNCNE